MINWNKYADKYYVVSWTKSFERRKRLEKQFVDINLKNFQYRYSCNPKYLTEPPFYMSQQYWWCTFTHYLIIKESYELGYESIIIMEDDLSFLKDIDEIENQLNTYYNTGDIVLFDYIEYLPKSYFLADFYRLNRNGMKYMIDNIEGHLNTIDTYFCSNENAILLHQIYDESLNKYIDYEIKYQNTSDINPIITISDKRICVQTDYDEINNKYILKSDYDNLIFFDDNNTHIINIDEYNL